MGRSEKESELGFEEIPQTFAAGHKRNDVRPNEVEDRKNKKGDVKGGEDFGQVAEDGRDASGLIS